MQDKCYKFGQFSHLLDIWRENPSGEIFCLRNFAFNLERRFVLEKLVFLVDLKLN